MNYDDIDWRQCYEKLFKLQNKILEAYRNGNEKNVLKEQHTLLRSFAARAVAVRKVTGGKGRLTPGVDKVTITRKKDKLKAINSVKDLSSYKASPVIRVYIPKPNGKKRPLGIPTIKDRIVQTMFHFALDPIAEETACKRSYGYRLCRGVHDNAVYLKLVLGSMTSTRRYVLKADIKNFFPSVNHKWLLDNVIMDKRILKEFLKAGFLEHYVHHSTDEGFPQGSPVCPVLANLTLNGLEEYLGSEFLTTRYADDFIIAGKSPEELKEVALPKVEKFLDERGLKIEPNKSSTYTLEEGFDFLGLNFKEYKDKTRAKGTKKGIFLVKPSSDKVKAFIKELFLVVKKHKNRSSYKLVLKLNQKLRGWAEHYRKYTSQKTFSSIHFHLWKALWTMLRKKHRRRNKAWLREKYFVKDKGNNWVFVGKEGEKELKLFQIPYVAIKRHVICKDLNAYDPVHIDYLLKRNSSLAKNALLTGGSRDALSKLQKGLCPVCGESLFSDEELEIHHIIPRKEGGDHSLRNLVLLHKYCHKQVEYSTNEDLRAAWSEIGVLNKDR